jgi:hypothetical protein
LRFAARLPEIDVESNAIGAPLGVLTYQLGIFRQRTKFRLDRFDLAATHRHDVREWFVFFEAQLARRQALPGQTK